MDPPALLNGLPFTQGRLLPESVLGIGRFQLSVASTELVSRDVAARKQKRSKTSPITYLAALLGFPLGFYTLFVLDAKNDVPERPKPPSLWADRAPPSCANVDPSQSSALAAQEFARASAKQERSPFSAEDGIAAVALYERAAACFTVDGRPDAHEARRRADRLREAMNRQYHVHQVRLERALVNKDHEGSLKEVRILLGFLRNRGGAYSNWLASLERRIELKFAGKKK